MTLAKISRQFPSAFNFVHGARCQPQHATATFKIIEPAKGAALFDCAVSTPADVDEAIKSARSAFEVWSRESWSARAGVLNRTAALIRANLEDLAYWETRNNGKPLYESRMDLESCADTFEFYASVAVQLHGEHYDAGPDRFMFAKREPLGVCAGIGAWNYPFQTCSWKVAVALACGNTFVYKPSPWAPMSCVYLAELLVAAGAPPGALNIVQGDATTGQALCEHRDVNKVSFTGSVPTGAAIQRACASPTSIKPVTLELGGKSPLVICEDADLDKAVSAAMLGNFLTQGEVCNNGTRVFVHRSIHDKFLEKFVARVKALKVGDPMEDGTKVGATICQQHMERVLGYVKKAKQEGAKVLCGGERVTVAGCENGYFISPCVLSDVTDNMTVAREEIFGAVASVFVFDTDDEALRRANATEYGLSAAVISENLGRAHRMANQFQAGVVFINCYNDFDARVPFGGYKQSGYGRENGIHSMYSYTQVKSIFVNASNTLAAPF